MYFDWMWLRLTQTISLSLCTALTADKCLPLGLFKWTVSGVWKTVGIPTGYVSPQFNGGHPIYRPTITKRRCQPIWGHVSYLSWSPIATSLGPCSSLTTTDTERLLRRILLSLEALTRVQTLAMIWVILRRRTLNHPIWTTYLGFLILGLLVLQWLTSRDVSAPGPFLLLDCTCCHRTPLCQIYIFS